MFSKLAPFQIQTVLFQHFNKPCDSYTVCNKPYTMYNKQDNIYKCWMSGKSLKYSIMISYSNINVIRYKNS